MNFNELEKICILMYGSHWKTPFINDIGVEKHAIQNWKRQGVPDWVLDRLPQISKKRLDDVNMAVKLITIKVIINE